MPVLSLSGLRRRRREDAVRELMKRVSTIEKDLAIVMSRLEGSKVPTHTDERFLAVAAQSRGRTMLTKSRLWTIWEAVRNVADLEGAAAEVGSYRGGTARFIAASFVDNTGSEVPIEVIDTFEGHPQDRISEHDSESHKDPSLFTDTSYENVAAYLSPWDRVTVHKGDFSSVAPHLPEQRYRLVHLDVDLYEPTLDCLRYFGDRMVPGGVIVVDDYGSPSCPGVDLAVRHYLESGGSFRSWNPRTKQLVLVK